MPLVFRMVFFLNAALQACTWALELPGMLVEPCLSPVPKGPFLSDQLAE